ncbi:hypothetical protein [Hydrogenophaga sp. ANAO-22]|uniref:hypothetical protein n=1 Tax=Hydrogenophaga sp. ANAO-22 TaxID=3166645 RepID=UPI0036D37A5D
MQVALAAATKFTAAELRQLLLPPQDALESMRKGLATEIQWMHLASVSAIALSVEHLGVVRHLKAQLDEADKVLAVIRQRAMKTGAWVPPILYGHEITAIQDLVRLHKFQTESLSAGEYRAAWQHAAAEVTRVGGRRISVTEQAAAC